MAPRAAECNLPLSRSVPAGRIFQVYRDRDTNAQLFRIRQGVLYFDHWYRYPSDFQAGEIDRRGVTAADILLVVRNLGSERSLDVDLTIANARVETSATRLNDIPNVSPERVRIKKYSALLTLEAEFSNQPVHVVEVPDSLWVPPES